MAAHKAKPELELLLEQPFARVRLAITLCLDVAEHARAGSL
jgi:hypothetical protein